MALLTEGDFKGHFIITAYLCWITAAQGGAGTVWMKVGVWSGSHAKYLAVKRVQSAILNHTCIILHLGGSSI